MSDIKKTCIQCGGTFTDAENGEGECAFHASGYDSWKKGHGCCGASEPCIRKKHRENHHCDYPYAKFFERSSAILNYCDTRDVWGSLEEVDLDGGSTQKASIGQLLRWKTRGTLIKDKNLLVVRVGSSVWHNAKYWFYVYNEKELDEIGKKGETLIFKSSEKSSEYSKAEWIIENQMVVGIILECKALSNEKPSILKVKFTSFPLTKGETTIVQQGGIVEAKPNAEYQLPDNTENSFDLSKIDIREAKNDFKTFDSISKKGLISIETLTKLICNEDQEKGFDRFVFHFALINAWKKDVMLMKLKVEAKMLNDKEWKTLPEDALEWGYRQASPLPSNLPSNGRFEIGGIVRVPHSFNNCEEIQPSRYSSWIAKHKPIRLRFTFESVKGHVSKISEYVQKMGRLDEKDERDVVFLFLDDDQTLSRSSTYVRDKKSDTVVCDIGWKDFKKDAARKAVFEAKKTNKSEIHLKEFDQERYGIQRKVFALIDVECQIVYAIKVQLIGKRGAKQAYYRVPFYGEDNATEKQIKPANEESGLPTFNIELAKFEYDDEGLDDLTEEDLKFDDDSDDEDEGGKSGNSVNLKKIEAKLDLLNNNVGRLADSLEQLVAVLVASKK